MNVDILSAGDQIPRIAACRALPGFGLEVLWLEGGTDIVDAFPALESRRVFEQVRSSERMFSACAVGEYGTCVVWPDGSELSALWIARLAEESSVARPSPGLRM
ncbi:hypothetical protein OIU34_17395 [Pararhizobium sp. BT-229]|uniref:hypothetical protein n=1 Tax=Pararhizobium sp. BT-229 TaxID=2986923 RepID=UPI0021F7E6F9|nr:hypothetical protein [Pararhizobium sp. BT-229]MCV9963678.1 hypothetical protein [Pararhizobium sp. BT-229]